MRSMHLALFKGNLEHFECTLLMHCDFESEVKAKEGFEATSRRAVML